ncbi:sn-glycerol-3-phosphate import ATP-binding protein UgpC [Botrimarina colliarenosi]|uniref:sn-glycerol-3-phosphate import ATP-binding protein UgpC n=1 Tax=Botrimarina colliarenosi TaxID=2528001 RepID=A0A5C6AA64_9BACT|nr:ABC transporter ATP-binding protein [Botrimarina colliarenosi]TWT96085.1 sn-glycerol-3-phosphate import ATP-binding protein UgpC [Botrimarina colliarenosi]
MATLTFSAVHKRYPGGAHAVRGIDLSVADGEVVVLLGPSGCGKTTTLRLAAGLESPTAGEVRIGERVVNGVAPGERDVAMAMQGDALYPHLSVRQNLGFGLKMRGTPRAEIDRRVGEMAERLGVAALQDRRPEELSGGERRRVALGRALVRSPSVLLLDEPLSSLDGPLRTQLRAELATLLRESGTTTLYVTHDQAEAMTLADRLVVMDRGVVRQVGAPLEVYQRPANRFAATYVGSPAMNLVDGVVAAGRFVAGRFAWSVDASDGPLTLGARAEDLRLARDGEPAIGDGRLAIVEHLGHETLAHYDIGGAAAPWVVRLAAGAAVPETAPLGIAPGGVHLFASDETGERIA